MESFIINKGVKLTAVALPLLLISEHYKSRKGRWIFKPLASTGFLISAIVNNSKGTDIMNSSHYNKSVILGLVLGAAGDVLLIPKSGFIYGLFSFLLGHITLLYAFTLHGIDTTHATTALAATTVTAGIVGRWLIPKIKDPVMKGAVVGYMLVISTMVVTASASFPHAPLPRQQLIGALMFYLSDLFVAREEFAGKSKLNQWIGLPLYYGGQILLASTLQ
ncbi:YhhN-like protein [Cunninghamella echinulata]|nr:YhhN-like protein [Cunninghamella echinulata]